MMITIIPVPCLPGEPETAASVNGNAITVSGVAVTGAILNEAGFDLTGVPDGGHAEPQGDHPFVGQIARIDGVLHLTLLWRYDLATAEPVQPDTAPVATVTAGPVPDPIIRRPDFQEAQA